MKPRDHTETFRDGPVYTVAVNSSDLDLGPEYSFSAAAGWLYTDWSEVCSTKLIFYNDKTDMKCDFFYVLDIV